MSLSEDFLARLQAHIISSINSKFKYLNSNFKENLLHQNESLQRSSSLNYTIYFNIFLKLRAFGFNQDDQKKALVEQIQLIVNTTSLRLDESFDRDSMNLKRYSMEKVISCFLMNSPFFSFLKQHPANIQPSDFEASITCQTTRKKDLYSEKRLDELVFTNHSISIGMFTINPQFISDSIYGDPDVKEEEAFNSSYEDSLEEEGYLDQKNSLEDSLVRLAGPIETQKETVKSLESSANETGDEENEWSLYVSEPKKMQLEHKSTEKEKKVQGSLNGIEIDDNKTSKVDTFLVELFECTKELKKCLREMPEQEEKDILRVIKEQSQLYRDLTETLIL